MQRSLGVPQVFMTTLVAPTATINCALPSSIGNSAKLDMVTQRIIVRPRASTSTCDTRKSKLLGKSTEYLVARAETARVLATAIAKQE